MAKLPSGGLPMRWACLLGFALIGSAFAAPVPKALKKQDDLAKLQGTWEIVTLDTGSGSLVQSGDMGTFKLIVEGEKLSSKTASSPGWKALPIKLDTSANPKRLDMELGPGNWSPCIYEFDGDTLKFVETGGNKVPPTEFLGGKGFNYFVWKKAKE